MDQPEENLDNQSVFEILVPFIKKAKQRRQIILVTHNPNIGVVCDAEQIINVRIDKARKHKVTAICGAIENRKSTRRLSKYWKARCQLLITVTRNMNSQKRSFLKRASFEPFNKSDRFL